MSLILTIINQAKPGQEISKAFEQEGTIGRSINNTWVLIDPKRFISSQHAKVYFNNGNYYITDLSTNGLFINRSAQPLGQGNSAIIKQGDILTIGEYEVTVSIEQLQQSSQQKDSPFDIIPPADSATSKRSFASPEPTPAPPFAAPTSAPVAADIGADTPVDPLALFDKPPKTPLTPSPGESHSGLDDLLSPKTGDTPWANDAGAESNHVPPLQQNFQPPQMIPEDWDFLSPAPQQSGAAASPPIPPLDFEKAAALPAGAPPTAAASGQANQAPMTPDESTVLRSLLEGLHMESLQLPPEEMQQFCRTVGEVARVAVEGMLTALRARSSIKSEFRMSMTMIRAKENNPLKFSASIDDALFNLFRNPSASYLEPTQAMMEGFNDLEAHMMATMAGTQVALNAVLRRFNPINLEQEFEKRKGGLSFLPGGKKAKHWEAYLELYKDIIASAEDDFQTLFGEEFTRAYEDQIRKLKQARGKLS